jgi:hypothetical protein
MSCVGLTTLVKSDRAPQPLDQLAIPSCLLRLPHPRLCIPIHPLSLAVPTFIELFERFLTYFKPFAATINNGIAFAHGHMVTGPQHVSPAVISTAAPLSP